MEPYIPEIKMRPQQKQGCRGGGRAQLRDGIFQAVRQPQAGKVCQKANYRGDNQRIFRNAQQDLADVDLFPAEGLQRDHGKGVEARYDNSQHDGCGGQIRSGTQLLEQRYPQKQKIAAEGRLDHHAPPAVHGLHPLDGDPGEQEQYQQHRQSQPQTMETDAAPDVGAVYVVKQHQWQEGIEYQENRLSELRCAVHRRQRCGCITYLEI